MINNAGKSGKQSGVEAFETGENFIIVKFYSGPELYTYSYSSAGKNAVEQMKLLAKAGMGLSTYISQHKPAYE